MKKEGKRWRSCGKVEETLKHVLEECEVTGGRNTRFEAPRPTSEKECSEVTQNSVEKRKGDKGGDRE